jgi:RNA polymerase sigma-70 factor (sigma-E family)
MGVSSQPEPVDRLADFERFALQASPVLLRSAFLLTGDWGHAEDLLQTTLLRVAQRWTDIDRSPEAYAHEVLINLYRDRHRGLTRRVVEVLQPDLPERPGSDSAERSIERGEMVWAVRGLPYRQREVVVLRFFLDLSVADTARLLGTSEGTVKSHTDRALKRLRGLLADQGEASAAVKEVPDAH